MAVFWQRIDHRAKLDCELWQAALDLAQPERGLSGWRHPRMGAVEAGLLGIRIAGRPAAAWPLVDAYSRDADFTICYGPTAESPYSLELVYSAGVGPSGLGPLPVLDLVVSVQTDLLDTHPVVSVASSGGPAVRFDVAVAAPPATTPGARGTAAVADYDELRGPAITVTVWQFPWGHTGLAYLEMVHPADLPVDDQLGDATSGPAHRLFGEFLEKGVIRRARLRGALVPAEEVRALAGRLAAEFLARPLPLSA